jgi:hypothetical protein
MDEHQDEHQDEFSSVDGFIHAARQAKQSERQRIEEVLAPAIEDPDAFSVPPAMAKTIHGLTEQYGDEALKNIAMYCLGLWHQEHQTAMSTHASNFDMENALWVMNDLSKLSLLLRNIADIGSFNGQEEYKEMLRKELGQAVIEMLEEEGTPLSSFGA